MRAGRNRLVCLTSAQQDTCTLSHRLMVGKVSCSGHVSLHLLCALRWVHTWCAWCPAGGCSLRSCCPLTSWQLQHLMGAGTACGWSESAARCAAADPFLGCSCASAQAALHEQLLLLLRAQRLSACSPRQRRAPSLLQGGWGCPQRAQRTAGHPGVGWLAVLLRCSVEAGAAGVVPAAAGVSRRPLRLHGSQAGQMLDICLSLRLPAVAPCSSLIVAERRR